MTLRRYKRPTKNEFAFLSIQNILDCVRFKSRSFWVCSQKCRRQAKSLSRIRHQMTAFFSLDTMTTLTSLWIPFPWKRRRKMDKQNEPKELVRDMHVKKQMIKDPKSVLLMQFFPNLVNLGCQKVRFLPIRLCNQTEAAKTYYTNSAHLI